MAFHHRAFNLLLDPIQRTNDRVNVDIVLIWPMAHLVHRLCNWTKKHLVMFLFKELLKNCDKAVYSHVLPDTSTPINYK